MIFRILLLWERYENDVEDSSGFVTIRASFKMWPLLWRLAAWLVLQLAAECTVSVLVTWNENALLFTYSNIQDQGLSDQVAMFE